MGKVNINDAYIKINGQNEAYIINMHISVYQQDLFDPLEERRSRKLLLHKKEIIKLKQDIKIHGFTVVPLKLYFTNSYVKLEIAQAKGKKRHDKRHTIKERDITRELAKKSKYSY